MPQKHNAVAACAVNVFFAVDVPHQSALPFDDYEAFFGVDVGH
jgi:hypothetical protein